LSVSKVIFYYLATLLTALSVLVVYSVRRRKQFEPTPSEDHIFRCRKCSLVYTDDPDVDASRCPHCGALNDAIEF
jgi:predicted Zn-ribbon and HTH transcriptional regulator